MEDCRSCRNWNGTCASRWGDCQHIICDILPIEEYEDRFGNACQAPFDPHDLRYYLSDCGIHKMLAYKIRMPYLTRMVRTSEVVIDMDDHGDEAPKRKQITYYQTHKDFVCERYTA